MRIQRQADAFAYRWAATSSPDWDRHYRTVDQTLTDFYNRGLDSRNMYRETDAEGQNVWSADRKAKQDRLIAAYLAGERAGGERVRPMDQIPAEHRAIIAGGISGAGKGTLLKDPRSRINRDDFWISNVDDLKELAADPRFGLMPTDEEYPELAGLSNMERTPLIHFEMEELQDRLAAEQMRLGRNIIHDGTMAKEKSARKRINDMKRHGYSLGGMFVRIKPQESLERVAQRHQGGQDRMLQERDEIAQGLKKDALFHGGRPVPSYVSGVQMLPDGTTVNEKVFDLFASMPGAFDQGWIKFDNSNDPSAIDPADPRGYPRPRIIGSSNSGLYTNTIPTLTAMRILAALRRMAGDPGEYVPELLDPTSIRAQLEMYMDGDIDFPMLVQGLVEASLQEKEEEEEQSWADLWLEAEGPADPNEPVWIDHAVANGHLTPEQRRTIFAEIGRALMEKDSVGGDAAFPGAGAAAPGSAPPPTPVPDDDDGALWLR